MKYQIKTYQHINHYLIFLLIFLFLIFLHIILSTIKIYHSKLAPLEEFSSISSKVAQILMKYSLLRDHF